jgi:hypothetical protein
MLDQQLPRDATTATPEVEDRLIPALVTEIGEDNGSILAKLKKRVVVAHESAQF